MYDTLPIATLPPAYFLLRVMYRVVFFSKKLLVACLVLFPETLILPFCHNFGGPSNYCCNKNFRVYHILCMSVPIFLYLFSLRVSLFITFISGGIATSVSNQGLSFLIFCMAYLPGPLRLFLSLGSIVLSYLAVLVCVE